MSQQQRLLRGLCILILAIVFTYLAIGYYGDLTNAPTTARLDDLHFNATIIALYISILILPLVAYTIRKTRPRAAKTAILILAATLILICLLPGRHLFP